MAKTSEIEAKRDSLAKAREIKKAKEQEFKRQEQEKHAPLSEVVTEKPVIVEQPVPTVITDKPKTQKPLLTEVQTTRCGAYIVDLPGGKSELRVGDENKYRVYTRASREKCEYLLSQM